MGLTLLCDVETLCAVLVVVSTAEELSEDRVVSEETGDREQLGSSYSGSRGWNRDNARLLDALGLDVPASEVVLEDADEALLGIIAEVGAVGEEGGWGERGYS